MDSSPERPPEELLVQAAPGHNTAYRCSKGSLKNGTSMLELSGLQKIQESGQMVNQHMFALFRILYSRIRKDAKTVSFRPIETKQLYCLKLQL